MDYDLLHTLGLGSDCHLQLPIIVVLKFLTENYSPLTRVLISLYEMRPHIGLLPVAKLGPDDVGIFLGGYDL